LPIHTDKSRSDDSRIIFVFWTYLSKSERGSSDFDLTVQIMLLRQMCDSLKLENPDLEVSMPLFFPS